MRSTRQLKRLGGTLLPVVALICAIPVAIAGAHGSRPDSSVVAVKGVVTTAPASGSDTFTATAFVAAPGHFRAGDGDGDHRHHGHPWGAGKRGSGGSSKGSSSKSYSYTYSGKVRRPHTTSDGTAGTVITTDSSTAIKIDGRQTSVGDLAVGDYFTAVYKGTPDESLSTITSTTALEVRAWAPSQGNALYAFVGTVSSVDTTAGTVSVNVMDSIPNGLFSGTDTFDVGSQPIVLGNSGSTLFGTLSNVSTGDVVAGGVIAPSGESASTVQSTPLGVLVDFPQSSSSSSASANADKASVRRAEHRALKLLRREQAKHGHHKKK
jgi:hypothetical protein